MDVEVAARRVRVDAWSVVVGASAPALQTYLQDIVRGSGIGAWAVEWRAVAEAIAANSTTSINSKPRELSTN